MLTAGLLDAVVVLPALSLTDALAVRPLPSPVIVLLGGQAPRGMLARPSLQLQAMLTSALYQPLALAAAVGAPLSEGGVLSMLMPLTLALAELPAASVAVPLDVWLAPSTSVCAGGQLATPERASLQLKLTVTSVLFQPLALAASERSAVMVGAVLSMLTVAGSVTLLRALSVAVPVTGWSVPSAVTVCGAVQLAIPETVSAQTKVTVTFVLFQPAALAAGDCVWLMVGGVWSILTWMLLWV